MGVVWAPAPFSVSGLLFFALTKRKSGWGICGSSFRFCLCCLFWFVVICHSCANSFLAAYTHVRTEPQCDIGQTRGKKKLPQTRVFFTSCFVNGPRESNLAESAFKILSVKFKFSFFLLDLLAFECYTRIFADISETRRLQAISFFWRLEESRAPETTSETEGFRKLEGT